MWPFKKKKVTKGNELTEEHREASLRKRRLNAKLRDTEKLIEIKRAKLELMEAEADLKDLEYDLSGGDDEVSDEFNIDSLAMSIISRVIGSLPVGANQQSPTTEINLQEPVALELSEQQIRGILKDVPKRILKKLKKKTDEEKRILILSKFPNISESSIHIAIQVLNE